MTLTAFNINFRTASSRRYLLVHEQVGKVVTDRRSDSLDTIRAERRRLCNKGKFGRVIIDTVTKEQVAP